MRQDFSFDMNCKSGLISPNGNNSVTITIEDCDKDDVLGMFDIQEFIDHFGLKGVLDQIGEQDCISHFGLEKE